MIISSSGASISPAVLPAGFSLSRKSLSTEQLLASLNPENESCTINTVHCITEVEASWNVGYATAEGCVEQVSQTVAASLRT